MAPTLGLNHSASSRVSNSSSFRRGVPQVRVGCGQEQFQLGGATGLKGRVQKSLLLRMMPAQPTEGGLSTLSQSQTRASEELIL